MRDKFCGRIPCDRFGHGLVHRGVSSFSNFRTAIMREASPLWQAARNFDFPQ
jgi:hypothetical protein